MSSNNCTSPEPTRRGTPVCPGAPRRKKRQDCNELVLVPPVCPVPEVVKRKQTEFEQACLHSFHNRSREEQAELKAYFRELFP
jgi:hypothetical protein